MASGPANWRAWTQRFLSNALTGLTMLSVIVVLFSSAAARRNPRGSPRATRQEEASSTRQSRSSRSEPPADPAPYLANAASAEDASLRSGALLKRIGFHLPGQVLGPLRTVRDVGLGTWYRGQGRWCPVCAQSSRKFRPGGTFPRSDAKCPRCGSLERHRLAWLYLTQRTDLFDRRPKRVLHIAPEQCFEGRFRARLRDGYLSADLLDPHVMERMDITRIGYPAETFDVVYCSHVLEHVPDDRQALREFRRVLKPTGWAILLVPITANRSFEDPTIATASERLRVFGQEDHVRRYGPDYVDRLREAGFAVNVTKGSDMVSPQDAVRMGISREAGEIFHCRPV
jgi:SAM-dependent methyltransferase